MLIIDWLLSLCDKLINYTYLRMHNTWLLILILH